MTHEGLLSGLPNGARALLASSPLTDPRLLELAARWKGLPPAQARRAEALRLFVVIWDPLEWLAPRPEAVATANAWPLELVVYVPVWSLAGIARRKHTTMAAVLAGFGASAITNAAAHEDAVTSGRYAELAARGKRCGRILSVTFASVMPCPTHWPRMGSMSQQLTSQARHGMRLEPQASAMLTAPG